MLCGSSVMAEEWRGVQEQGRKIVGGQEVSAMLQCRAVLLVTVSVD